MMNQVLSSIFRMHVKQVRNNSAPKYKQNCKHKETSKIYKQIIRQIE